MRWPARRLRSHDAIKAGRNLALVSYSHSYEADVVKPLTCFFRFLHHFRWFRVWQMRARNERTAAKTQKTVTCQCAAKLGQQRNGIIGRGPRSGKETVYAGFDLDQA